MAENTNVKKIVRRVPEDKLPKKRKKKKPIFWLAWLTFAVVVAVVWSIVLVNVSGILVEYEAYQPHHVAERVLNDYFLSENIEKLIKKSSNIVISQFESTDDAVKFALSLSKNDGELGMVETSSGDLEAKKYNVYSGDARIAAFTLVKSGEKSKKLGLDQYSLGSIEYFITPMFGANVYAPIGAKVLINGKELTSEHKNGEPVLLAPADYFQTDDESVRAMQNYYVNGLFSMPDVKVMSAEGNEYKLSYDEKNASWRADIDYVEGLAEAYKLKIEEEERLRREEEERIERELQEKLQKEADEIRSANDDYIIEATKTYARWMQADATKAERNKYFDTSSEFFKSLDILISQSFVMWHEGYRFDDVVSDGHKYENEDKTEISCRVKFTQVLINCTDPVGDKSYPEWKDSIDVRVFLRKMNGKWLIYDIRNS